MRGRVPVAKRKPCAIPLCPALRKKGSYVCAAHAKDTKTHHNGLAKQPKAHKYGAVPTVVDGIRFDSKSEAARWQELRLMEKAGAISDLQRQVRWPLLVGITEIGAFVTDYQYVVKGDTAPTVEDRKGVRTPVYRWKAKHFKAQYGFAILET